MTTEQLVYGFQQGAQKTLQRVLDSFRKQGIEVEVSRINVKDKVRLALKVSGEILHVTPFDGRLVLHLPNDVQEVIGVRKTSWRVAESILYELPSRRIPRLEQQRLDALARVEARKKAEEEQKKARVLAREQLAADFAAQEEEVRVTRTAFNEVLKKYRACARVQDIYFDLRSYPPVLYSGYSSYPDRKATREPRQPGTAVVQMKLTPEELELALQILKK